MPGSVLSCTGEKPSSEVHAVWVRMQTEIPEYADRIGPDCSRLAGLLTPCGLPRLILTATPHVGVVMAVYRPGSEQLGDCSWAKS